MKINFKLSIIVVLIIMQVFLSYFIYNNYDINKIITLKNTIEINDANLIGITNNVYENSSDFYKFYEQDLLFFKVYSQEDGLTNSLNVVALQEIVEMTYTNVSYINSEIVLYGSDTSLDQFEVGISNTVAINYDLSINDSIYLYLNGDVIELEISYIYADLNGIIYIDLDSNTGSIMLSSALTELNSDLFVHFYIRNGFAYQEIISKEQQLSLLDNYINKVIIIDFMITLLVVLILFNILVRFDFKYFRKLDSIGIKPNFIYIRNNIKVFIVFYITTSIIVKSNVYGLSTLYILILLCMYVFMFFSQYKLGFMQASKVGTIHDK